MSQQSSKSKPAPRLLTTALDYEINRLEREAVRLSKALERHDDGTEPLEFWQYESMRDRCLHVNGRIDAFKQARAQIPT